MTLCWSQDLKIPFRLYSKKIFRGIWNWHKSRMELLKTANTLQIKMQQNSVIIDLFSNNLGQSVFKIDILESSDGLIIWANRDEVRQLQLCQFVDYIQCRFRSFRGPFSFSSGDSGLSSFWSLSDSNGFSREKIFNSESAK